MAEPLRIMHVLFRFGIGGLENGLVNLINGLDEQHYRHWIVCLADYDERFARRLRACNVELCALGKRPGQDPRVWWRMWRLLRRVRPHVVHTRNIGALELQVLAWLARVPGRVHGEHGWDVNDLSGTVRKYRWLRRAVGLCVRRFIALSRDLERYLVDQVGIAPAKVSQIYNGVDSAVFHPAPAVPGPLVIGTVGRMKAVKNQTLLVQAFLELVQRRPDLAGSIRLRLIGSGPLEQECRALVAAAGAVDMVEFRGDSARVAEDLRALHLFVLPSQAEGISNTILEAMASGLPVVATAVGGNAELVVAGETGCLVALADRPALVAALERYVDDPALRARHGRRAREVVEARFGLPRMIAAYDEIYRSVAR